MSAIREKPRVLAIATHPIQYHAPWYRKLEDTGKLDLEVLFVYMPDEQEQGLGYGVPFSWDIPLLEGYRWACLPHVVKRNTLGAFSSYRLRHVLATIRNKQPDAVILNGWNMLPLVQVFGACQWLKIPTLVRGDSNAIRPRSAFVKALHRLIVTRYDAFLTVGRANMDFYQGYGIPSKKMFSAPHFIDNKRFAKQAEELSADRLTLRDAWSVPHNAVTFCFAGRMAAMKKPFDLLEAFKKAYQTKPESCAPLHLLFVGAGELKSAIEQFIARHKLPVSFTGFLNQTEIARAYVAADCLVLPSDYYETWGLVVNEAMACKRPAIVSDRVGCAPDLIQYGRTGTVFPFGNTDALSDILIRFASAPEKLAAMGENAQRHVRQNYSVERCVEGTLAALAYVLKRTL